MKREIKKVVLIGPESTGKSTLARQLADHYKTLWVPEYAREYLEKNGTDYDYDDLLNIAKGQIGGEEKVLATVSAEQPILFVDTDMYVMKVWSEYVFNKCDSWVLNQVATRKYDLYLLCNVDLPWVKDHLREYPDRKTRNKLYHFYQDHLVNQQVPWYVISGGYEQRLERAIAEVDRFMNMP